VGTSKGKLQVSRDDGATWTAIGIRCTHHINKLLATPTHVYALSWTRLFRAPVGTDDWAEVPLMKGQAKAALMLQTMTQAPDGTLWIGGDALHVGVLLRSADGVAWTPVPLWAGAQRVLDVATQGQEIWCCTYQGLFRSLDAGATWAEVTSPLFHAKNPAARVVLFGRTVIAARCYDQVVRSDDGGATWTVEFTQPGPQAESQALVPSASGHLLWLTGSSLFCRDEPQARAVAPAPAVVAPAPPPAAVARTGDAWDARLGQALASWQHTRDPAMADLVGRVAARLAPVAPELAALKGLRRHQAWMKVAGSGDAAAVDALLATLAEGTLAEVSERMAALDALPDDPRVALHVATWLATYPFGSTGSKPLWGAAFRLLARLADERAVAPLQAALGRGVDVNGETMRTWLQAALPRALADLEAACRRARRPPGPADVKCTTALAQALRTP
jgi:hypothetical protein